MHREMEEAEDNDEDTIDVIRDKAVASIVLVAGTKYHATTIKKKVEAVITTLEKNKHVILSEVASKASERLLRAKSDARAEYFPAKAEKTGKAEKIDLDEALGFNK